jgi:hypothetical protein
VASYPKDEERMRVSQNKELIGIYGCRKDGVMME